MRNLAIELNGDCGSYRGRESVCKETIDKLNKIGAWLHKCWKRQIGKLKDYGSGD